MKLYFLIDSDSKVACISSDKGTLHKDKIERGMRTIEIETEGLDLGNVCDIEIGDFYNDATGKFSSSGTKSTVLDSDVIERKIRNEMRKMAIERLIARKEIPDDYKENI